MSFDESAAGFAGADMLKSRPVVPPGGSGVAKVMIARNAVAPAPPPPDQAPPGQATGGRLRSVVHTAGAALE